MGSSTSVYKWSAVARIGTSAVTFGGNLALARLLDPADFGLLAAVALFQALAYNLSTCGLSDGLIRNPNPTERDYNTLFWFNAGMGLVLCAVFVVLSPAAAWFFDAPPVRPIMCSIGVNIFFGTLYFVTETRLRKQLQLKKIAIATLGTAVLANGLGIVLALCGMGWWALVCSQVCCSFFSFVCYAVISPWRPRLEFDTVSFRRMFSFGIPLMLSYMGIQTSRNVNTSVLGKYVSKSASGLYFQAAKLQEVPFGLLDSIFNWPFYAVLSNQTDTVRRRAMVADMCARLLALNAMLALFLFTLSEPVFYTLYGHKWDGAIPIFQLLLVFGVAQNMKFYFHTTLKIANRTRHIAALTFAEVGVQLALLFVFYRHGVMAIAMTQVAATSLFAAIFGLMYRSIYGFRVSELAAQWLRPLVVPCVGFMLGMLFIVLWVRHASPAVECVWRSLIFAVAVVAAGEGLRTPSYLELRNMLISKILRK